MGCQEDAQCVESANSCCQYPNPPKNDFTPPASTHSLSFLSCWPEQFDFILPSLPHIFYLPYYQLMSRRQGSWWRHYNGGTHALNKSYTHHQSQGSLLEYSPYSLPSVLQRVPEQLVAIVGID